MKIKKVVPIIFAILLAISAIVFFYLLSNNIKFNKNKILYQNSQVVMFDSNNRQIKDYNNNKGFAPINTLNSNTKNAFISIEDKNFYNHNGINYKRIVGATFENIKNLKFKQGASTISQQLIKNTHLTNEKTIKRKFNEILLTKKLEDNFSKDEILEYYINIIYYGDNCYGIENASNHYFSIPAKNLNLSQSAFLAGIIKSPNYYNKNIKNATDRRNTVLKEMYEDKKISFEDYISSKNSALEFDINKTYVNKLNTYQTCVINEAINILDMPKKQIMIGGYKIYTYQNSSKQQAIDKCVASEQIDCDYQAISLNAKNNSVEAYTGKSNIALLNIKRQPASAIKPVLVYAPAINENIISPLTQINDEKIDINGYSPKNSNNTFCGYTSARECLSKSLNVPAVKILGYTGIEKSKRYAKKCNIEFDKNDNNLSIALGGMTYGTTLINLSASYGIFANNGIYTNPKFISHILDKDNNIIYKNPFDSKKVIRDDTAYLITDMLKTCGQSGTAKKFSDVDFDVATKTGTAGNTNNTDAYNIAYTTNDICGVWFGNADNTKINYIGGGQPTSISKKYLNSIYQNNKPKNFEMPSSVFEENIDAISLKQDYTIFKANEYIPQKYQIKDVFSKFNQPKQKSSSYISVEAPKISGVCNNQIATLCFKTYDYLIYEIYKIQNGKTTLIEHISNTKQQIIKKYQIDKKTQFFVVTKIKNFATGKEIVSEKSNIITLIPKKNNAWYL